jgi:hypothetical protein
MTRTGYTLSRTRRQQKVPVSLQAVVTGAPKQTENRAKHSRIVVKDQKTNEKAVLATQNLHGHEIDFKKA